MICTLRDELMQKCQEIIELEATLSPARKQVKMLRSEILIVLVLRVIL